MNLTSTQKLTLIITIIILVAILGYVLLLKPIYDTQNNVEISIQKAQRLNQQLLDANILIGTQTIYPVISSNAALEYIQSLLGVKHSADITPEGISVRLNKQNFDALKQGLYALKTTHGIVVINTTITKVAEGLVDAELLFKHP